MNFQSNPPAPGPLGVRGYLSLPSTLYTMYPLLPSTLSTMYLFPPSLPYILRFLSSIVSFSSSLGHLGSSVDARGGGGNWLFPTGGVGAFGRGPSCSLARCLSGSFGRPRPPRIEPRAPKSEPRAPRSESRPPQDPKGTTQDRPRAAQEPPRAAQDHPKRSQERPESPQERPRGGQDLQKCVFFHMFFNAFLKFDVCN